MREPYRIGLIVPSSNTTMETEIPALLRRREESEPETFTFHSSRVRMQHVTEEELAQMVRASDRCAAELSDARVDAIAYACLVAIMAQGPGFHVTSEERLARVAMENGGPAPVVSSAGALVKGIRALGATKVALVAPYMKPLTELVVGYLADQGIEVLDAVSLEVSDNLEVARLDPEGLLDIADGLHTTNAEAIVLSACVQMRSLPAVQRVEDRLGLPVLSAATATAYGVLTSLDLRPVIPEAGSLLSGAPALSGTAQG